MGGECPSSSKSVDRRRSLLALILLVPAQGLGVWAMLIAFPGAEGKFLSAVSRLWMLGFPLFWTLRVDRVRIRIPGPSRRGIVVGILSGLPIFAVILATYALFGRDLDTEAFRERARSTGFDQPIPFALVFAYIILVNSILEEYVWRWFVYRKIEEVMPSGLGQAARKAGAVVVAAMLFTAHHVVALSAWVGLPLVLLGSVGVFLGAVVWSAIFARERSLWPCYISHILADLAILVIGYDALFRPTG